MTNGVGWACRLETEVATVEEAAMKEVEDMEEMKEEVVVVSGRGGGGTSHAW